MYYPERATPSPERSYLRALGNLLDNYGNPVFANWCNGFLDWLEGRMENIPNTWSEDTIQDAARDYTNAVVEVPKPRRWTWGEWLSLTLVEGDGNANMYMWA